MNGVLLAAVRQAINDADGAAMTPDDLLTLQAEAAVHAMEVLGYIEPAGWEYAVIRGEVTEAGGFAAADQADRWAKRNVTGEYVIRRRPVGVWEDIDGTPGWQSESPGANTNPDGEK